MGKEIGGPVHGILHSTDASSGVAVPIFQQGDYTAYTLQAGEYIVVESVHLVAAAGGDCYVLIGADATVGTGETVIRGTIAANGVLEIDNLTHTGRVGHTIFVVAPAGAVDVKIKGHVRKAGDGTTVKPAWREADFGQ